MSAQGRLHEIHRTEGARFSEGGPIELVLDYGDWQAEHKLARNSAGLEDRSWRGLIEVGGKDRTAWLHNLVTNEVKNLRPGEANYAFAINVKGRVLFDANVLVEAGRIWLDIDARFRAAIVAHLEKYVISEDVTLADRSGDFVRLAVLGPRMKEVAGRCGPGHAAAMAQLQHAPAELGGASVRAVRHDYAGQPGLEYVVPADAAAQVWRHLLESVAACGGGPVGWQATRCLRMEAGIPAFGEDIDDDVIPPETGQIERGISYQKGCYLGQEVIERMRSHNVLARRLVGLRLSEAVACPPAARLLVDDAEVGRLTSTCHSPLLGAVLGLGYVKTVFASPARRVTVRRGDKSAAAELIDLPVGSATR